MLRNQTRTTQFGWALVTALTLTALIPSTHWLKLLAQLLLFGIALVYVWYVSRPARLEKHIELHIEGVEPADRARFTRDLTEQFGERLTVVAAEPDATDLTVEIATSDTLAELTRSLRAVALPMGLLKIEGRLAYTTTSSRAHLEVEVRGVASPDAKVFLPGLKDAIRADRKGRFSAHVPFEVIRNHANKGYLPGVWRKDKIEQEMRVPIPT